MSFPTEEDRVRARSDFAIKGTHQPSPPYHWLEEVSGTPGSSYFRDAEVIGWIEDVSENSFNAYNWNAGEKEPPSNWENADAAKYAIEQRVNDLLA